MLVKKMLVNKKMLVTKDAGKNAGKKKRDAGKKKKLVKKDCKKRCL